MKKDRLLGILLTICILLMFYFTVRALYFGAFAFWFDPARDLGLGLANLKKLSLIGHPSGGLAGVFYGPYYIWFISFAELISKDPRWVWFMVATVPYFTLFPLALYKLRKYSDVATLLGFFLLFLLSFNNYSQVWNPNPVPIMYLFTVYFASKVTFRKKTGIIYAILTGLSAGLIANFHMSYGIAIVISFFLIFLSDMALHFFLKSKERLFLLKSKIISLTGYVTGVFLTYVPFLLFELRHGFNQTKIIIENFELGLKGTSLNLGQGFSKTGIINFFFMQGGKLLHISPFLLVFFLLASFGYIFFVSYKKKKKPFTPDEKQLLILVTVNAAVVLSIFLLTKNPVYDYFFIGVEMFFFLIALLIIKKIPFIRFFFIGLAFYLFMIRLSGELRTFHAKNTSSNYESKRKTVEMMFDDVKKSPFTVFIYDPAIYTFDYNYLIEMYREKYGFGPSREKSQDRIAYVILPQNKNQGALQSFTDYHTPNNEYKTTERWMMDDGTVVLRRERLR